MEPPPSHGVLDDAVGIVREALAAAEGQLIGPALYKTVAEVEIRVPSVETQIRRILYTDSV